MPNKILAIFDKSMSENIKSLQDLTVRLERFKDYIVFKADSIDKLKSIACFDFIIIIGRLSEDGFETDLSTIEEDYPNIPKILITTTASEQVDEYRASIIEDYGLNDVFFIGTDRSVSTKMIHKKIKSSLKIDFIIITVLAGEFSAVANKFENKTEIKNKPYLGYHAELKNHQILIVKQDKMGQSSGAALAALLCSEYNPNYVFLVGIAGGKKGKVKLGSIIVANQIIDITVGDDEDGQRKSRPSTAPLIDSQLLTKSGNYAKTYIEDNTLNLPIEDDTSDSSIEIFHEPMLSGNDVIKYDNFFDVYEEWWKKVVGVEMECAGIATAISSYIKPNPAFLMIRSFSDYADEYKKGDNDKFKDFACEAAADYTFNFLKECLCKS